MVITEGGGDKLTFRYAVDREELRLNNAGNWAEYKTNQLLDDFSTKISGKSTEEINDKIGNITTKDRYSGCYIFIGCDGTVLYVGKSRNLRNRLKSHFTKNDHNTRYYIDFVQTVIIICTEQDYDSLEISLMSELQPMFNGPISTTTDVTAGGYRSLYHKRTLLNQGDSKETYEEMTFEWHSNPDARNKNQYKHVNTPVPIKEERSMLNINLNEVKDFMREEDFDRFVLRKLSEFIENRFEGEDGILINGTLERLVTTISQ